ncbi:MAG: hypothetical protein JXB45_04070 [Candidatus Krumholzibacteriota bacterium]|nr:hypothetical protein [Candidatus Krumholzibacteriota bacterium]
MRDLDIKKTSRGYEVLIDGKVVRIYQGSQDAKLLYEEIRRNHSDLSRQLEMQAHQREWWQGIENSTAPNNAIDIIMLTIMGYFKKKRRKK